MAERKPLTFRCDSHLRERIESHKGRRGHDSMSDSIQELTEVGLREMKSPLVHRWKATAIDSTFYLSITAIVVAVLGMTTDALAPAHATAMAFVLLAIAAGILATTELVRALNGQSELSGVMLALVGRVRQ